MPVRGTTHGTSSREQVLVLVQVQQVQQVQVVHHPSFPLLLSIPAIDLPAEEFSGMESLDPAPP